MPPLPALHRMRLLKNPVRGTGIELAWAAGLSDVSKRGSYIIAPRGGAVVGFDRLNIQTDNWDLMSTSPQTEVLGYRQYVCL